MNFKYHVICTLVVLALMSCHSEQVDDKNFSKQKQIPLLLDSVKIIHANLPLVIPVNGTLQPWQSITLTLPDSTRIISLLTEPDARISKGDLLASLWKLTRFGENTPIDLFAPIDGQVDQLFYQINQVVPAFQPILRIKNTKRFVIEVSLEYWQSKYIKLDNTVIFFISGKEWTGYVSFIDKAANKAIITVENKQNKIPEGIYAKALIHCGKVAGDYILTDYFSDNASIEVQLKEKIELTVFSVGVAESLSLIYPPLPAQNYIRIFKKNLDL